jgi:hypothetical protein
MGVRIDHVDVHDIAATSATTPAGHAAGNGIILFSVEDGVVERCRVHDNGTGAFYDSGVAFGSYFCKRILFQYNEAYGNKSMYQGDEGGFDFDRFTTNSIMQFNYSHDNDGWGYMIGSKGVDPRADKPMVENNVVRFNISARDCRNSNYGALLFENWAATNVDVYNNTFYMNSNGSAVAPAIGFLSDDVQNYPPAIKVYNNLFLTESSSVPVVVVGEDINGFPVSGLTFWGNDYYSNDPTQIQVQWLGQTYPSEAQFRFAVGGQEQGGQTTDPRLNPGGAPTISNINMMDLQLRPFFQMNNAPKSLREGGVDLASVRVIGPSWWTPDQFDWGGKLGSPQDFFGVAVPTHGLFSIGASQSVK